MSVPTHIFETDVGGEIAKQALKLIEKEFKDKLDKNKGRTYFANKEYYQMKNTLDLLKIASQEPFNQDKDFDKTIQIKEKELEEQYNLIIDLDSEEISMRTEFAKMKKYLERVIAQKNRDNQQNVAIMQNPYLIQCDTLLMY